MALGRGMGILQRGSVDLDPESLARREKLAEQLYASSIVPQAPEQSWTQGAARMAQALVSNMQRSKVGEDKAAYQQQQAAGMAALLNGNGTIPPEVAATLPPNQQMYVLQMMQQQRLHDMQRAEKTEDRKASFEDKVKYAKEERNLDPSKKIQDEIYKKQLELQDPSLPAHLKPEIEAEMKQLAGSISAMSPSRTTVNVDASQKAQSAGDIKYEQGKAESLLKEEDEIYKAAKSAPDNLYRLKELKKDIESGGINNLNTTPAGTIISKSFARLGLPNDSAEISKFYQTTNEQLVQARSRFAQQGPITEGETAVLRDTILKPDDTVEALVQKMFVIEQVEQRSQQLNKLTNEWKRRFGATTKPSEDGTTFREAVTQLYADKPIISYAEEQRRKQEAASRGVGVQQ
jgi:hypothetical protein